MSTVHWADTGSGPSMVLLHAFPCDHRMWDAQVPALVDAGWRVLVPDLPGFGDSSLPNAEPSLRAVVRTLADDLLAMGVDRLVLGGLSVGGYLAMEWLRAFPEMLAGVVLCDTKATVDTEAARQGRRAMAEQVRSKPDDCAAVLTERLLPGIVGATTHATRPHVVEQVRAWMDSAQPETVAWFQEAMADRPDSVATLAECELPVLLVRGDEDGMSDAAEQAVMMEALADARLVEIPQAGHLSAVENPQPVTQALMGFAGFIKDSSLDG